MAGVAGISATGTDRLRRGRTTAVMATLAAPSSAATLRASRRPPLKVSRPGTWIDPARIFKAEVDHLVAQVTSGQ
jgi:hypothetical protein